MSDGKRVALITGGSRGIGRILASALAEAGMDIALAARNAGELEAVKSEVEKLGAKCFTRVTDVAKPEDVTAFVEGAHASLGRIDVLVNSAGVYGAIGEITQIDLADWRKAIEVNLLGTVYATRAVLPFMGKVGGGKVINFAGGGVGGPNVTARVSAYATSKAAVLQFTECVAKEAAAYNVQVNAIAPGAVVTGMTAEIIQAGAEVAGRDLFERTRRERETGNDRAAEAKACVLWLASPQSGALTGKTLSATRDDYKSLDVAKVNASSLYTIRRIDNGLYLEAK